MPAPATGGRRRATVGVRRDRQRPRAPAAAGGLAAARAGDRGEVAPARDLDEHRGAVLQGRARRLEGHGRDAGGAGGRIAQELAVVLADGGHARGARADSCPVGDHVVGPAAGHEQRGLGGARDPGHEQGRAVAVGAGHGHVAGVRVGARGSAWESSPSSHTAISPGSATGAKAAARVPTTIRTPPRAIASQRR